MSRTVAIPGIVWDTMTGSSVLQGPLEDRVAASGYCADLVYALAAPTVIRRGRGCSYHVDLTDAARADLSELIDALSLGARDDGTSAERAAFRVTMERLG